MLLNEFFLYEEVFNEVFNALKNFDKSLLLIF